MTEEQKKLLIDWIKHQTYSEESHYTRQGKCEWLRADEMIKYLPDAIDFILKNNKLP